MDENSREEEGNENDRKNEKRKRKKNKKKKKREQSALLIRDGRTDASSSSTTPTSKKLKSLHTTSATPDDPDPPTFAATTQTLDVPTAKPGCSWGSAFAAAASVEPEEELDADFLARTQSTKIHDGLAKLATLHREGKSSKKRSPTSDELSSGTEAEEDTSLSVPATTLEGKLVDHPLTKGETLMVLVDKSKGTVYSSTKRDEDDRHVAIGTLHSNDSSTIQWDLSTLEPTMSLSSPDTKDTTPSTTTATSSDDSFPFEVDQDDHCETPLEAYQHIVPLLKQLVGQKDEISNLRIYDPYYCNGAVKRNLRQLGFPNVYNEKEDCYQVWKTKSSNNNDENDDYDVLVTNPPYSGTHIAQLMKHVTRRSNKPWFLLLPQWVHKRKDEYVLPLLSSGQRPFFLIPHKRYVYLPPPNYRTKKVSDVHKKSSPFVSMWYIWGGNETMNQQLMNVARKVDGCDFARSKNALRDLRRKHKRRK